MKFTLVLCLIAVSLCQAKNVEEEIKEIKQKAHDYCRDKTGTSEELIQKEIQEGIYTNNENLKCYEACKLYWFDLVDEKTGKYTPDKFLKKFPKELTDVYGKVLTDCNVTDFGDDRCEEAWQYLTTCYVKQPTFAPF